MNPYGICEVSKINPNMDNDILRLIIQLCVNGLANYGRKVVDPGETWLSEAAPEFEMMIARPWASELSKFAIFAWTYCFSKTNLTPPPPPHALPGHF